MSAAPQKGISPSKLEETIWPEALPKPNEHCFFSVTCEDYNLLWCFHEIHNNMEARLIWRCPNLEEGDLYDSSLKNMNDKTDFFSNHLPGPDKIGDERSNPHDYIFGRKNPSSYDSAARQAATREAKTTVYVVSSDPLQAELIFKLFSCIPSRVYLMKSSDFFKPSERRTNMSIRADRLAALRGSAHLNGFPSIIFDADSTMTYTAADSRGRLLGGGISPGIPLRLQSISGTSSSELDLITEVNLYEKVKNATASKRPLPIFSNNREDSVITTVLSEVSHNARSTINIWLEKVGLPEEIEEGRGKDPLTFCPVNNNRDVAVTGKNAMVLNTLLKANHGGVIECSNKKGAPDMNAHTHDKLIPLGIQNVIGHQVILAKEKFVNTHINKRVAKEFLVHGRGIVIKRGVIVSVSLTQGINVFLVRYDDKTVEHVTSASVVAMRKFFKEVGGEIKSVKESASESSSKDRKTAKGGKKVKMPTLQNKKRAKEAVNESEKKKQKVTTDCVGKKIAKYFGSDVFYGLIESYTKDLGGLWHIRFTDGDEEDMDWQEVTEALRLWTKLNKHDVINIM